MEENLDFEEIENQLKETADMHLDLNEDLQNYDQWQERLHELLQEEQELKSEILMLSEENCILDAILNPDALPNKDQIEKDLGESKRIVDELKSIQKESETKMGVTVHEALQSVLKLKEVNAKTEEKFFELESQRQFLQEDNDNETSLENMQRQQKTRMRKTNILVEGSQANFDNFKNRHNETKETLNCLHELSISRDLSLAEEQRTLARLTEKLNDIEAFAEVKCSIVDKHTVKIDILPDGNIQNVNQEKGYSHISLEVMLKFKSDNFKDLCGVEISEPLKGADDIIKEAIKTANYAKLIGDLKLLWCSSASLFAEIHSVRSKYAVDWIPDKEILHLMVKKGSSVVCTLNIPEGYPHSKSVSLVNIVGDQTGTDIDSIQVPSDDSLTGWVIHLESIFNKY